jgi:hypothetical protein
MIVRKNIQHNNMVIENVIKRWLEFLENSKLILLFFMLNNFFISCLLYADFRFRDFYRDKKLILFF